MVLMELRSLKVNDTGDQQYIALGEKGGDRTLTIVIGYHEIQAISRFVNGVEPPRPLTHDLAVSLLDAMDAVIERVDITKLEEGTFYAVIHLRRPDGESVEVDARPSDAIALATALGRPVYVEEAVIEQAAKPL